MALLEVVGEMKERMKKSDIDWVITLVPLVIILSLAGLFFRFPIVKSWKEESSTTAISFFVISSRQGISALPILPPRKTLFPSFSSIFAIRVVVVVLPLEPVTAIILHGQYLKNTSISVVTV